MEIIKNRNGSNKTLEKLKDFMRSQDNFGHPITFNYKQSSTFKTKFGGFLTIAFKIGILIYLVFELIKVVDRKYTVTNSMIKRNLFVDTRTYTINQHDFDVGFSIYGLSQEQLTSIDNYVNITFEQGEFNWTPDGKSFSYKLKLLEIGKCGKHRFKGETFQTESLGITQNYLCPVNYSASFQGSFTTKDMQFSRLKISKCNQTNLSAKNQSARCADDNSMRKFLDSFQVNMVATNQFIDINEKSSSPIKTVLKNFYSTGYLNMTIQYQLKVGQNFLITSTSSLSNQISQLNETYYTIRDDVMQISSSQISTEQVLICLNMMIDDNVLSTNLELYTISDALSNTGGIIGIVTIIIQFLVSKTQENFYYQQLAQDIFQINKQDSISLTDTRNNKFFKKSSIKLRTVNENIIQPENVFGNYNRILGILKSKTTFKFSKIGYLLQKLNCCQGKKLADLNNKNYLLFNQAKNKLNTKFEIVQILKTQVLVSLIKKITLSKYQRKLIPFFKKQVLKINQDYDISNHIKDHKNIKKLYMEENCINQSWDQMTKNKRRKVKLYLAQILLNKNESLIDKRIYKNLDEKYKPTDNISQGSTTMKDSILKTLNKEILVKGKSKKQCKKLLFGQQFNEIIKEDGIDLENSEITPKQEQSIQIIETERIYKSQINDHDSQNDFSFDEYIENEL
ncbi:UNKNOWN [Stylonychia lemnae]|uniref:Uncharacterized protein n=1 Tax=Stylonychia lemnae TaxID=5949 RepID=A0A077ZUK6_STYLE|nr:UNKNOWN [Stylonychia lemnae]|eukprot:CDW73239.1 UNKNOWN [Stylonychia lemnae]